jgi:SAM-dependent methyltransferase
LGPDRRRSRRGPAAHVQNPLAEEEGTVERSLVTMSTCHLDIGCGDRPKNPYGRGKLYGLDIAENVGGAPVDVYSTANLALEKIPFDDNFFDSVSAYDFLEHMPRVICFPGQNTMRFPFVELMNEIWRVLKNDGLFYASTPCYPSQEAFIDPTHVNFITKNSHIYFTRPFCLAKIYGFVGNFDVVRVKRTKPRYEYEPYNLTLEQKWQKLKDTLKKRNTYMLWEFRAVK